MKEIFKSKKRWIAFFLALLLIVTTCINSSDVFLWATGEDETTASDQTQAESENKEEVVEMEVKDEEETEPEDQTNPEGTTDAAEGAVTDEVANGEDQQDPAENPEQETDENTAQAPVDGETPEEEVTEENPEIEESPEIPVEEVTYGYTVYYYYDGVEDESARVEGKGALGDAISVSAESEVVHNEKNYVLDHVENKDGKIGEDAGQNEVKVYYVLAEEVAEEYTVTLEHVLSTDNLGTFRSEETFTITDENFVNGSVNLIDHAYSRDGMECLTENVFLSKEDFGEEHQAFARIDYGVAEGWIAVAKSNASAPASNGPRRARAIYVGRLDDVEFVQIGQIPVTVEYFYEDGTVAGNAKPPVVLEQDTTTSAYYHEESIDEIAGYTAEIDRSGSSIPSEASCTLNGTTLIISFPGTVKEGFTIAIVYKAQQGKYNVVHRLLDAGYKTVEEGHYTDKTVGTFDDKKVGERTEVEAGAEVGYTAKAVVQQEVKADESTTVIVEYIKNAYTVKYNTQGGSYVPMKTGYYNEEVEVYSGEAAKPAVPESKELICKKEEHTHTNRRGSCYELTCTNYNYLHWHNNSCYSLVCKKEEHRHSDANGCYKITPAVPATPATFNPAPTRQGYTFTGWYTDAACTQKADEKVVMTGNIEVFAGWKASEATYTVAYFKEVWDNSTNSSYYAFVKSEQKTATVGTNVNGSGYTTTFTDSSYYQKNTAESSKNVEVKADGTTVVEVKYDLKRYTLIFNLDNYNARINMNNTTYSGSNYKIENVVLGQDVASKWPTQSEITGATNFYAWERPGDTPAFATKRFEVTTDMLPLSGNSLTYTASWQNYTTRKVEYWLQSADDDSVYELKTEYSQEFKTNAGLDPKSIYGFSNISTTPRGYNGDGYSNGVYTYRFYYNRKTSTITYQQADGSRIKTENVKFGANINTDTYNFVPNRPADMDSDYTFKGWYDNNQGVGEPYKFTTMPDGGLILYAIWEAPEVTVTIHNTENDTTITVKKNELATIPVPEKPGYIFDGWYTTDNFAEGSEFDASAPIANDVDIYAKWVEDTTVEYTIRHIIREADGTERNYREPVTRNGIIGETISARPLSVKVDGKDYVVDVEESVPSITLGRENTAYEIKFIYVPLEGKTYTVSYQYNGDERAREEAKPVLGPTWNVYPNSEIKKNLNEDGYKINEKLKKAEPPYEIVFTLSAIDYRIEYAGIDEDTKKPLSFDTSNDNAYPKTYTVVDGCRLANPSIEGYEFLGWTTDGTINGAESTEPEKDVILEKGSKGHLTFTAHFRKETAAYTVEYYRQNLTDDGYTKVEDETVNGNGRIGTEVYAEEKTFEGYTVNSNRSTLNGIIRADGSLVLRVYYDRKDQNYTVKYLEQGTDNELSASATKTAKYGDVINANTPGVVKNIDRYSFIGTEPKSLTVTANDEENIIIVYYEAKKAEYTIKYWYGDDKGNFAEAEDQRVSGEKQLGENILETEIDDPTTYNNKNYMLRTENGIVYGSNNIVSENAGTNTVDIYYVLDANENNKPDYLERKVTYDLNGGTGEITDENRYLAGETVTITTVVPQKEGGAVFAGWKSADVTIGSNATTFEMPDKDVTLTAQWKNLSILKQVTSEPEEKAYKLGEEIAFDITVENTGDVDLENVTITDTLPGAKIVEVVDEEGTEVSAVITNPDSENPDRLASAVIATLKAGNTVVVKASYNVQEADLGNKNFFNTATANVEGIEEKEDPTEVIPVDGIDEGLTVTKRIVRVDENDKDSAPVGATGEKDGKPAFTTGDTVTFEIVVTNTGNKTLENITVEEALREAVIEEKNVVVNFVSRLFKGVTQRDGEGQIAKLKPGDSKTITATYTIVDEDLERENPLLNVATATVTTSKGEESFEGESDPIPLEDPKSSFELTKAVSGTAHGADGKYVEGDELTYTITVENTGNTALKEFRIKDTITAKKGDSTENITERIVDPTVAVRDKSGAAVDPAATLLWQKENGTFEISEIPNHGSAVITYTYRIQATDAGKTINNVAVAEKDPDKKGEPEEPVEVEERALEVEKEITDINGQSVTEEELKTTEYKIGDVIHFTVKVTNTGNVTLENIVVTDTMTGGSKEAELRDGESNEIVSLAAGASVELHYSYTVEEGDLGEKLSNRAKAVSGNTESNEPETPEVNVEDEAPKAAISKTITNEGTAEGGKYEIGKTIEYQIVVENTGNTTLNQVVVEDTMTNASGPISNIKLNGEKADIWNADEKQFIIPSIDRGESATITYEYVVQEADAKDEKIDNVAAVKDIPADQKESPSGAEVERRSLEVTKTVQGGPADGESYQLDEEVIYVVTVTNNGNVTLSNITVTDEMNAAGEADFDAERTADANNPLSVDIREEDDGKVSIDELNIGDVVKLYYVYQIAAGDIDETVTNTVTNKVTVEPEDGPEVEKETDPIPVEGKEPGYTIVKTIEKGGSLENGNVYAVGDFVEYQITVENTGNVALENISVKDEMENASGDITDVNGADWDKEQKTFTIDSIPVDGVATITYQYEIQKADLGKTITNIASIGEQEAEPDKPVIVEERSLEVVKEVLDDNGNPMSDEQLENAEYKVGNIIDFRVTVTNTGNVPLNNVTVTDRMWAGKSVGTIEGGYREATLVDGEEEFDLAVNGSATLQYQYTIKEDDLDYKLYNQATASGEHSLENPEESDTDIAGPITVEERDPKVSTVKTVTPPTSENGMYKVDDIITYQIAVTNEGNTTLKNVVVKDTMTGAAGRIMATSVQGARYKGWAATENGKEYTFEVAEIPVGATRNITYSYKVQKDDVGKTIGNAAVAEDIPEEKEPENPDPIVIENRKLEVTKAITSTPRDRVAYQLGETIRFSITVKNAGNVDLEGIELTDIMNGAAGNATVGTGSNTLTVGTLRAGEERQYSFAYTVREEDLKIPGEADGIKNTATAVASDGTTGYGETEYIKIGEQRPDFTVAKRITSTGTAEDGKYAVGGTIRYEITVANTGNTTLRNIVVRDTMTGATGTISNVVGAVWQERSGSFSVNEIAVGSSATITYDYVVQPEDAGKTIRNTAIGKPWSDVVTETEIENKELGVMKYVANRPANGTGYVMGEEILFGVTVRNIGNVSLSDIRITDEMHNATGQATPVIVNEEGETEVLDSDHIIGRLGAGEYTTVYYSYIVQEGDIGKTDIYNAATATSGDGTTKTDETRVIPVDGLYTITIHYVYTADGTTAAADYTAQLPAGKDYLVYSPAIEGYNSSAAFITGTMPGRDLVFTVYYTAPTTPGGDGGGTTPTPPTPPTPDGPNPIIVPDIPVPAGAVEVVIPAELVPLGDEEVPLQGAQIDIDEDGNVTITPISEEEIPLAGGVNDDHLCCILHFLLMLAALIIYSCYTDSMKKHQKKLAELKDQLAEETLKKQLGITDDRQAKM